MRHHGIRYRKISSGRYKYQLLSQYTYRTQLLGYNLRDPFVQIYPDGRLVIKKGYAWDGPSGPSIDTKNFMRGSLVHDALYQLLRYNIPFRFDKLPYCIKPYADDVLWSICVEDGMSKFRASYVRKSVQLFGGCTFTEKEKEV